MKEIKIPKIEAAHGLHGHLRWYDTPKIDKPREYLIGNLAGLYAYKTGTVDSFRVEELSDPRKRTNLVRTIYSWLETRPTRKEDRYMTALYIACPGQTFEKLEEGSFDIDLCKKWYQYHIEREEATDAFFLACLNLWKYPSEACIDLEFPTQQQKKIISMNALLGRDVESCLNAGWNAAIDIEDFNFIPSDKFPRDDKDRYFTNPVIDTAREVFVKAWKEEEARLLDMPPMLRDREFDQFGV